MNCLWLMVEVVCIDEVVLGVSLGVPIGEDLAIDLIWTFLWDGHAL